MSIWLSTDRFIVCFSWEPHATWKSVDETQLSCSGSNRRLTHTDQNSTWAYYRSRPVSFGIVATDGQHVVTVFLFFLGAKTSLKFTGPPVAAILMKCSGWLSSFLKQSGAAFTAAFTDWHPWSLLEQSHTLKAHFMGENRFVQSLYLSQQWQVFDISRKSQHLFYQPNYYFEDPKWGWLVICGW